MREKRRQNGCPGHIMQKSDEKEGTNGRSGGMRAGPKGYHFKRILRKKTNEESRMKGEYKVECKTWSAKGTYRKASADREPTTYLNTLGAYGHVRIY